MQEGCCSPKLLPLLVVLLLYIMEALPLYNHDTVKAASSSMQRGPPKPVFDGLTENLLLSL